VLALQREDAQLRGRMGELAASKAQAEGRITELDLEILKLATTRREEAITRLRDLRVREVELMEKRNAAREKLARLDIRAPVSGVVYGLTVFGPQSVIRPAEPILYIVPQDRPLVIPDLKGRVAKVSADAFVDERTGLPYYRVEIVLDEGEMTKLGPDVALVPGMPVEAFMRTADRTPLAYLLLQRRDLSRLKRVVKLTGFVNSTPDFTDQPKVINGASDLMVEVFGEAGRHSRAAVSAASLPFGVAVEIEAVFEIG